MAEPDLSRPLVLQAPTRLSDGAGGYAETWAPLGTLWAEVRPVSGGEYAGPETALSRISLRITCRAAPQDAPSRPRPGQRFLDGARVYAIAAVTEADAAQRFLVCYAREEAAP